MELNTGPFGLSFSTGLMLEALFNNDEPINTDVKKIDMKDYDIYMINIYTVIRNLLDSVVDLDKEKLLRGVYKKELTEIVTAELSNLDLLFAGKELTLLLLINDYKSANKLLSLKDKQVPTNYKFRLQEYLMKFVKEYKKEALIPMFFRDKDWKLKEYKDKRVLLTTHIGIDMLNMKIVKHLDILESHTGKVLKEKDLYKKFNKLKSIEMSLIPYNQYTLYVYGDEPMTAPMDLKTRRSVFKECFENKKHFNDYSVYNCVRKVIKLDKNLMGV